MGFQWKRENCSKIVKKFQNVTKLVPDIISYYFHHMSSLKPDFGAFWPFLVNFCHFASDPNLGVPAGQIFTFQPRSWFHRPKPTSGYHKLMERYKIRTLKNQET